MIQTLYLSTGRLAAYLNVSRKTITNLVRSKKLLGEKDSSGDYRIGVAEALDYCNERGITCQELEQYAERNGGLAPYCPPLLLVSSDTSMASAFAGARFDVTVAINSFQSGMLMNRHRFRVVIVDAVLGYESRVLSSWIPELYPAILFGLIFAEDAKAEKLPGVDLNWKRPVNAEKVIEDVKASI